MNLNSLLNSAACIYSFLNQFIVVGEEKHIKTSVNYFIGRLKLPGISSVMCTPRGRTVTGEFHCISWSCAAEKYE